MEKIPLEKSWLDNIYRIINDRIEKISNGVAKMTVPSGKKVEATNINTIVKKLDVLKKDKYFSTARNVVLGTTYTQVNSAEIISNQTKKELDDIAVSIQRAVCKNSYKNSHGINSHGTYTTGNNKTVSCSGHTSDSKVGTTGNPNGNNQHVDNNDAFFESAVQKLTNSHGTCSQGGGIDILNNKTEY